MDARNENKYGERALILATPAIVWLGVFVLVPLAILLVFSLQGRDDLGRVQYLWHFDNFERFVSGPYLKCLARSVGLASITTISLLVISYIFCLWLAFAARPARRSLLLLAVVLPLWTSSLLRIYAWITILRPTGIIAHLWGAAGMGQYLPPLLYTPFAVWLGMVYNYLPFMILPLYTAIDKVDRRYIEAAFDLGAHPLATVKDVLMPLTRGGIIAGAIMVFIPALGDYVVPDLMGGGKSMYMGNLIQNQFLLVRDWAFGSAVSTILIAIVSVAIYVYMRVDKPKGVIAD
ncbi:MAG: ABC transporter permease [Candidatus Obscuribacterales bacterium]|jgi:spermidine/putrescine transport system permease protein|nr:ABC transporter permease [Candidatus Obscuribacterales bacterium]